VPRVTKAGGDSQPLDMVARHRSERDFFTTRSIKNYFDHTAIVVVMVVAVL
jgi:hypothetical protein